MRIGAVELGGGAPLVLIAGLNVIEDADATLACARTLQAIAAERELPLIFKASFDKANRSSLDSFRGVGLERGLEILGEVGRQTGLPLLTDVHETAQVEAAAAVVDCLQVPAFLCRQTDLIVACAASGRPVNLKKGPFASPQEMRLAVEKARKSGGHAFVTERGTRFGYHDLVVDMRSLTLLRAVAPVCFDATHAVQYPGSGETASGGDRRFVAPLARAAVAAGVDALFLEAHPDPDRAPCDGPSQIDFDDLSRLLVEVCAMERALGKLD